VNGVAVTDGSSFETGGTAPAIPTTRATTRVPPLSGGTLMVLADGRTLVASDPDRDRLYVFDTDESTVRSTAQLQVGDEPGRAVEDAAARVHVVLRRGGAVVTLNPKTGVLGGRRAVCPAPRGIAYDKGADQLHVACAGGELVSLPAAGGDATRRSAFERDLRDVVMGANGTLLVSTFRKADVLVIGPDGTLATRLQPGSGLVSTRQGSMLMRTPSVAWRMVTLDEATSRVVLLHQTGVTDTVDTRPGGYAAHNGCSGIVAVGVSVLSPEGAGPKLATGFGELPLTIDVALSPDRKTVALAVPGNGPYQGPTLLEKTLEDATLATPSDCASESDTIRSQPKSQVVAVTYAPSGVLFAQTREPAGIWRSDTGMTTELSADSPVDSGHFAFHANSGGGITCASCHPEGGEDGRTWTFVCAGPRRTQSMRGGISPTIPFHWDGSEADLPRLVEDVFTGRMAGPLLSHEEISALQAWVDTIAPLPGVAGLDRAAVDRGKALFNDSKIACASCHAGALLTNNATVDVGTGRAFQVSSLLGLAWRAPYMHDGCATSLRERFGAPSCGGGEMHGSTSTLSASNIDDLLAYLESL
jgi:mono/diheme cytochrome c family protein